MIRRLLPLLGLLLACDGGVTEPEAVLAPDVVEGLLWTGHLLAGRPPTDLDPAALAELSRVEGEVAAAYAPLAAAHDQAAAGIAAALGEGREPDEALVAALVAADRDLRALAARATADGLRALGPPANPALPDAVRARGVSLGPLDAMITGHGTVAPLNLAVLPPPGPPDAAGLLLADLERERTTALARMAYELAVTELDPAAPDLGAKLQAAAAALDATYEADLRARLRSAAAALAAVPAEERAGVLATEAWASFCDLKLAEQAFPFASGSLRDRAGGPPSGPAPSRLEPPTEGPGMARPGSPPGTAAPGGEAPGTAAPGGEAPGTAAPGGEAPGTGTAPGTAGSP